MTKLATSPKSSITLIQLKNELEKLLLVSTKDSTIVEIAAIESVFAALQSKNEEIVLLAIDAIVSTHEKIIEPYLGHLFTAELLVNLITQLACCSADMQNKIIRLLDYLGSKCILSPLIPKLTLNDHQQIIYTISELKKTKDFNVIEPFIRFIQSPDTTLRNFLLMLLTFNDARVVGALYTILTTDSNGEIRSEAARVLLEQLNTSESYTSVIRGIKEMLTNENYPSSGREQISDLVYSTLDDILNIILKKLSTQYDDTLAQSLFLLAFDNNILVRIPIIELIENKAIDGTWDIFMSLTSFVTYHGISLGKEQLMFFLKLLDKYLWSIMPDDIPPNYYIRILQPLLESAEIQSNTELKQLAIKMLEKAKFFDAKGL